MRRPELVVGFAVAAVLCVGCSMNHAPSDLVPVQIPLQHVLDVTTRDRWMHAAQRPEFTPFAWVSFALQIDGTAPNALTGERTLTLSPPDRRRGNVTSLIVRRDGSIVRRETQLAAPDQTAPGMTPNEAVPRVHPGRFAAGQRWMDTIAVASEIDGSRQALDGVRVSTLVKDTVVGGRSLWIVRDSARVRYIERRVELERTLDTMVTLDRTATGLINGRYLYDRVLGMYWSRVDTTLLNGDAVLRYPDGRSFRTTARYERMREMTLREPAAYVARLDSIRKDRARTWTGPVRSPTNETEERLARGDTVLRDSLLAATDGENDPNRRQQLYWTLTSWARNAVFGEEVARRRAAAGDSAFAIERLWSLAFPAHRKIDRTLALEMIRVMQDPGISLAVNLPRDPLYENLTQMFTIWPRALEPDTTRWKCTPEACALLEQQFVLAQEPRLRDVGLTALVTRDPVRWADSLAGRPRGKSTVLRSVTQLANGRTETFPGRTQVMIPTPDADWHAWTAWVPDHLAVAIRFYGKRAGRDMLAEIRRRYASAPNDSARLVFGALLASFGETESANEIATHLRSGSEPRRQLAIATLPTLFGPRAPLADSAAAVAVVDRVFNETLRRNTSPSFYVRQDSVPAELRSRWSNRFRFFAFADWQRMSEREAGELLSVSGVERIGSLARVHTEIVGRTNRQPNETPRLYHGGATYYMLETNGAWTIVVVHVWET
jgi:hypothetical protein